MEKKMEYFFIGFTLSAFTLKYFYNMNVVQ